MLRALFTVKHVGPTTFAENILFSVRAQGNVISIFEKKWQLLTLCSSVVIDMVKLPNRGGNRRGMVGRMGEKRKRIFHLTGYIAAMVSGMDNRGQG